MDINELNRFGAKGIDLLLYNSPYTPNKWGCTIKSKQEGMLVEVTGDGDTAEVAVIEAIRKFERLVYSGAPELDAPMIEHQSEVPADAYSGDSNQSLPSDDEPF